MSITEILFRILQSINNIIQCLGLSETLQTVFKAIMLEDKEAYNKMRLAFHSVKIVDQEHVIFRGRLFYVPLGLLKEFLDEISLFEYGYKFSKKYDVIVDIGGFLGESAWYFLTKGLAKKVIVYEPVYYNICRCNLTGIAEIKIYPYAIYKHSKQKVKLSTKGLTSRVLEYENEEGVEALTVSFEEILREISGNVAVKVDCEGCEQYLAEVPCNLLRKAQEYIVEVHPWIKEKDILKHFKDCGYRAEKIRSGPIMYRFKL